MASCSAYSKAALLVKLCVCTQSSNSFFNTGSIRTLIIGCFLFFSCDAGKSGKGNSSRFRDVAYNLGFISTIEITNHTRENYAIFS